MSRSNHHCIGPRIVCRLPTDKSARTNVRTATGPKKTNTLTGGAAPIQQSQLTSEMNEKGGFESEPKLPPKTFHG